MSTGLYRTFKTNHVPYFPDGNGRDRYIAYNNAGFFKDFSTSPINNGGYRTGTFFSTKIITHTKSTSVKTPNFHYYACGNGRDKYILVDGGGLFTQTKPLISYKLTDFLRKNDESISPVKKMRRYLSRDEKIYNKLLKEKEKDLIKRLYTNSRKKITQKSKLNLKSLFSTDECNKESKDVIINSKNNTYSGLNKSREKNDEKKIYMPKIKIRKMNLNHFNKATNKNKPNIIIDSNINNKIVEYPKMNLHLDNNENFLLKNYSTNFYTDLERLKNYQFNKKPLNIRKRNNIYLPESLSQ